MCLCYSHCCIKKNPESVGVSRLSKIAVSLGVHVKRVKFPGCGAQKQYIFTHSKLPVYKAFVNFTNRACGAQKAREWFSASMLCLEASKASPPFYLFRLSSSQVSRRSEVFKNTSVILWQDVYKANLCGLLGGTASAWDCVCYRAHYGRWLCQVWPLFLCLQGELDLETLAGDDSDLHAMKSRSCWLLSITLLLKTREQVKLFGPGQLTNTTNLTQKMDRACCGADFSLADFPETKSHCAYGLHCQAAVPRLQPLVVRQRSEMPPGSVTGKPDWGFFGINL